MAARVPSPPRPLKQNYVNASPCAIDPANPLQNKIQITTLACKISRPSGTWGFSQRPKATGILSPGPRAATNSEPELGLATIRNSSRWAASSTGRTPNLLCSIYPKVVDPTANIARMNFVNANFQSVPREALRSRPSKNRVSRAPRMVGRMASNRSQSALTAPRLGVFSSGSFPEATLSVPPGPKISLRRSHSSRGDLRDPSDGNARVWLDELNENVPDLGRGGERFVGVILRCRAQAGLFQARLAMTYFVKAHAVIR